MDTVTEVTHQSWGHRLKEACKGVIFGFLLLGGGIWLLNWNEGRSVRRYRALQEGKNACIDVDIDTVLPENEKNLVHFVGEAIPRDNVTDSTFGVTPDQDGAIKLRRNVEMYQWEEHKHSVQEKEKGGSTTTTTTYTYSKDWESRVISSSFFHEPQGHENPGSLPFEQRVFEASQVYVGAFHLSSGMVGKFNWYHKLSVSSTEMIPDGALRNQTSTVDGGFYMGDSPGSPRIGDTRIHFDVVWQSDVSIVAQQLGDQTAPYTTSNGNSIFLLMKGTHSAEDMFIQAERENTLITWGLRFLGTVVIYIGLRLISAPVAVIADYFPACGDMVEVGTDLISTILAGIISTLVIAVSWIYYRPVVGGSILLATATVMFFGSRAIAKRRDILAGKPQATSFELVGMSDPDTDDKPGPTLERV